MQLEEPETHGGGLPPPRPAVCLRPRVGSALVRRVGVRWQPQSEGSAQIRARLTQAASSARALPAAARPFHAQQRAPWGQSNRQSPSVLTDTVSIEQGWCQHLLDGDKFMFSYQASGELQSCTAIL